MLTEKEIQTVKAAQKPQKLFDEDGLYLLVKPNGRRLWRQKYRFGGKEKLLGLGRWPLVSLKEARERRDDIRNLVEQGIDPSVKRREAAAAASANTGSGSVSAQAAASCL